MPDKKTHVATITPGMHYTLFIALVLSLITTFFLGLLLEEALFGAGLNYFAYVREQGNVRGVYAAPQTTTSILGFTNQLKGIRRTAGGTYYDFTVAATNNGKQSVKKLVFAYQYDPNIFEYIVPPVSMTTGETKTSNGIRNALIPTAHAQVSIDFPPFPSGFQYTCTLDTSSDPQLCDLSSGGLLKRGDTWQTDLTFKLKSPYAEKPSFLKRIFAWLFGLTAKAQVSIDFPTFFLTTTTATVVEATTANNQPLEGTYSASTSVTVSL
ncbi:MAG: hypothetical protein A3B30_02360 [Candidatus Komeilibacteria bacterium RIFCSPLOWO2_01_FULL_52_15]|uniref:Uncharacterized protein n=2 Tax=Candidatus Komeiliibacteriota TaxID=1817908 RepID=A0A1G2BSP6_9BACT|nr:MAG: hypothetical protein A2677_03890 [Candidatus Komeilibacteria bacterium RIFCSPHIGHO2_01_FULL_52_14]OGY91906.1 MAG: hypothetical protein A3B30_02360 [Candidatus Komeilibacteria bacterium RIFCSPLOWO2_01_FULL_52_15]